MRCKWRNRATWVPKVRQCGNRVKKGSENDLCWFHVQLVLGGEVWRSWG